jgi:hypothetical protein
MWTNFLKMQPLYIKLLIIGIITNTEALENDGGEQRFTVGHIFHFLMFPKTLSFTAF